MLPFDTPPGITLEILLKIRFENHSIISTGITSENLSQIFFSYIRLLIASENLPEIPLKVRIEISSRIALEICSGISSRSPWKFFTRICPGTS